MTISVTKVLTPSDWYAETGSTTITLNEATQIITNSKKALIKIQIPQSAASQASSPSDKGLNYVKDLKKVEDQIKIKGWLADDTGSSAWTKAWQLRGMSSSGGPLADFTLENLSFDTGSQEAYLEEVNFIAHPLRTKNLRINETSSASMGVARIEVDLSIYLGDAR